MTGKKHVGGKIFRKKPRKLNRTKLDLKWKERVKLFGGLMAELRAVQAELKREIDERVLELRSDPNPPNPHALQLAEHQLRKEDDLPSIWDISAGILQMDLMLPLNSISACFGLCMQVIHVHFTSICTSE
ncbi:hypothetical protein V6N13_044509 [Hibiscus sabdariffa]|uniref:Uncharacterized protein n=1 Tax=Hibiscus sabdariffa TaxID=183260 RepID=A0ABR2RIF0_9ROSI